MRWLIVSSQHHPSHGGIGTYVARFTAAAIEAGWTLELITRPSDVHPRDAIIHEITTQDMMADFVHRLPELRRIERVRPYRYGLWSRAVAKKLLDLNGKYDAIEFVDCQAEGFVSLASRRVRNRFRGVPMIVHAHTPMFIEEHINGVDMKRFGRNIYHHWEREALRFADGVIVTSDMLARRLAKKSEIAVIPYPIAPIPSVVTCSPNVASETVLLIGSVQPRKGVETWARSLNQVFAARPNARAILAGPDTPTGPGASSMADHVRSMIEPHCAGRFHWAGAVAHDEIRRLIDECACVVVPSLLESFSFAVAEALDRMRPVIVSDQVGIAEHVPGLATFPVGDVEAMARSQIAVLQDLPKAQQAAKVCQRQLWDNCSPARHLELRERFLQRVRSAAALSRVESPESDALDAMDEFLASVEVQEQSVAGVSSDRL